MARTSSLDSEIRSRIDSFLEELSALVKQSAVEAVRDALGQGNGVVAPARRGPGRPPKSSAPAGPARRGRPAGARGRGGKRSSEDLGATSDQILEHVRANPGQRAEQIGSAIGLSTREMRLPIQKLLDRRSIRTEGQRRGTKYFAGARGGAAATRSKGTRKGARKGSRKTGRRASGAAAEPQALAAAAR